MKPEFSDYPPLDNLLRGADDDESYPKGDDLTAALATRGINVEQVISRVEEQVSAALQREHLPHYVESYREWRHRSVRLFAGTENPVVRMTRLLNEFVLEAFQSLDAPPKVVDPFWLAELKHIPVVPNSAIADARLVPLPNRRLRIEYNPNQPKTRMRFSIAHELAHTFFPDCHEEVRNRLTRSELNAKDWELEMLCNFGAAELLMPIVSFPELRNHPLDIDSLRELRKTVEVSFEALLLRVAHLTPQPCCMFAASRYEEGSFADRYRLDYTIRSRSWRTAITAKELLPRNTVVANCAAIGFTAKGDESWPGLPNLHIECVGIPPYRGARYPRAVGIIRAKTASATEAPTAALVHVVGDVTRPHGSGVRIIAFNVNDKALSWGKGVARAVASKWPEAQTAFREWVLHNRSALRLGSTFKTHVEPNLWVFQLVCQHGYGPSPTPRLRYGALKSCLEELTDFALRQSASIHIPRLGTGEGGAPWPIIAQIVDETACRAGVPVTVYDWQQAGPEVSPELPGLFPTQRG